MKKLKKLKDEGKKLSDAETFINTIGSIERLSNRLKCIIFKLNYNEMTQNIATNLQIALKACDGIISSQKFHQILMLVLSIGNHLNGNSNIGGAVAFDLSILTKLQDTKGYNSSQTLLHFLAETLKKKYPELMEFKTEICHVCKSANINVNDIEETIGEMTASSEILQEALEEINVSKRVPSPHDKFEEVMSRFSSECHDELNVLSANSIEVQKCCQILCVQCKKLSNG